MAKKNGALPTAIWFLLGILVGAVLIAVAFTWLVRDEPQALEPTVSRAPAAPAPAVEPPTPKAEPTPVELTPEQRQIAEDAAATGLTEPAGR